MIERYFSDELSESDKVEFDLLYQKDPDFKEDVEAQKLLIHGLELINIKNDLKQRFQSFHQNEEKNINKVIPFWRKKSFLGIAATFTLFIAFSAYAIVKLNPFNNSNKIVKESLDVSPSTPSKDHLDIYSYNYQRVKVNTSYANEVTGGYGTRFNIPSGSFVDQDNQIILDTTIVDIVEILNPEEIQALINNSNIGKHIPIRMIYLKPYYKGSAVLINHLSPPVLNIRDFSKNETEVYFGGQDLNNLKWRSPKSKSPDFIKTPDKIMEDYKRYVQSLDLLDSVKNLYTLNGDVYTPKAIIGQKMELSSAFVTEIRQFVTEYQQKKNFNYNVNLAEKKWDLYFQQRNIKFNLDSKGYGSSNDDDTEIKQFIIYEPGWYVVVRKP